MWLGDSMLHPALEKSLRRNTMGEHLAIGQNKSVVGA